MSGGNGVSRLLLGGDGQGGGELAAYGKIDESDEELLHTRLFVAAYDGKDVKARIFRKHRP